VAGSLTPNCNSHHVLRPKRNDNDHSELCSVRQNRIQWKTTLFSSSSFASNLFSLPKPYRHVRCSSVCVWVCVKRDVQGVVHQRHGRVCVGIYHRASLLRIQTAYPIGHINPEALSSAGIRACRSLSLSQHARPDGIPPFSLLADSLVNVPHVHRPVPHTSATQGFDPFPMFQMKTPESPNAPRLSYA